QYYKGIEVDGIKYVLHVKDGRVYSASGKIVKNLDINIPYLVKTFYRQFFLQPDAGRHPVFWYSELFALTAD
ncbi:MAG: hypothetical protein R6V32_06150, partial [Bacteroidales bacterium]